MTRINIKLPEEIHKKIKIACAMEGKTIKQLIEEVLEKELKNSS